MTEGKTTVRKKRPPRTRRRGLPRGVSSLSVSVLGKPKLAGKARRDVLMAAALSLLGRWVDDSKKANAKGWQTVDLDKLPQASLSLRRLREVNVSRCNAVFDPLMSWGPSDWGCALAGEAGEAANVLKKLRRLALDLTARAANGPKRDRSGRRVKRTRVEAEQRRKATAKLIAKLAEELADVVCYADLTAARFGIDLGEAIRKKFNKVSRIRGATERL